jgi:hypothetical protein
MRPGSFSRVEGNKASTARPAEAHMHARTPTGR